MQAAHPTGPSQIDYYSAEQYEAPEGPYSLVTAADGSAWYQVAAGEGSAAFYDLPEFSGSTLEKSQVREDLPRCGRGHHPSAPWSRASWKPPVKTAARSGTTAPFTRNRDAPHSVTQAANGVEWYQMEPPAQGPDFETGEQALAYNRASFQNFMPGFEQQVTTVDGSHKEEGHFEVPSYRRFRYPFLRHYPVRRPTGETTKFMRTPKDNSGYAIHGEPAVERKPVYLDGKAVYEEGKLKTTNVETVRYKSTPTLYQKPQQRPEKPPKPPRKKGR